MGASVSLTAKPPLLPPHRPERGPRSRPHPACPLSATWCPAPFSAALSVLPSAQPVRPAPLSESLRQRKETWRPHLHTASHTHTGQASQVPLSVNSLCVQTLRGPLCRVLLLLSPRLGHSCLPDSEGGKPSGPQFPRLQVGQSQQRVRRLGKSAQTTQAKLGVVPGTHSVWHSETVPHVFPSVSQNPFPPLPSPPCCLVIYLLTRGTGDSEEGRQCKK